MHGFRVAAEVAFIALVFHSVVEGMALLAVVQSSNRAADVQLAILAHHAPLTAAVALPFLELQGARSAAARVAIVGLSGAAGIVLGQLVPGLASGADAAVVQRATALTAGALLHVVSDEIREQRFGARWQRALDMLACALGFGLAGLGAFFDLPNAQGVVNVGRACVALGLAVAPALVAGLVVRWATMRFAPRLAEPLRAAAAGIFPVWALLGFASAAIRLMLGALFWSAGRRLSPLRPLRPQPLPDEYAARAPPVLALFVLAAGADALAPPGFFASRAPVLFALALAAFAQASASGAALAAAALVHRGLPANLAVPFSRSAACRSDAPSSPAARPSRRAESPSRSSLERRCPAPISPTAPSARSRRLSPLLERRSQRRSRRRRWSRRASSSSSLSVWRWSTARACAAGSCRSGIRTCASWFRPSQRVPRAARRRDSGCASSPPPPSRSLVSR
jgi:hypothetical protein